MPIATSRVDRIKPTGHAPQPTYDKPGGERPQEDSGIHTQPVTMAKIIAVIQVKGGANRSNISTIAAMRRWQSQAWCQQHIAAL